MTGKPGRSGGARPGAGRPLSKWTISAGKALVIETAPDEDPPAATGQLADVAIASRTTLILTLEDGRIIGLIQ